MLEEALPSVEKHGRSSPHMKNGELDHTMITKLIIVLLLYLIIETCIAQMEQNLTCKVTLLPNKEEVKVTYGSEIRFCYAVSTSCHNARDKICPNHCDYANRRRRRKKRSIKDNADYDRRKFKDEVLTKGLQIGAPDSWLIRRRNRWGPGSPKKYRKFG